MESWERSSKAERRPAGFRVKATAVASARVSRFLEIAAFKRRAAKGARMMIAIEIIKRSGLELLFLLLPLPPSQIIRVRRSLKIAIAPAVVAAMAATWVSLFATWASSWATTPWS